MKKLKLIQRCKFNLWILCSQHQHAKYPASQGLALLSNNQEEGQDEKSKNVANVDCQHNSPTLEYFYFTFRPCQLLPDPDVYHHTDVGLAGPCQAPQNQSQDPH